MLETVGTAITITFNCSSLILLLKIFLICILDNGLIYYYQAWFNETPKRILRNYLSYQRVIFLKLIISLKKILLIAPELSKLALYLFGICINGNVFSQIWKFLNSNINDYILLNQSKNDNEFTFNAFNDSDTEELEETSVIDECNVNDTFEKTNNSDNINSEQWTKIIENWIKMVNAEINIDNTEVIGEETYKFEVGRQSIHSADNLLAKWKLLDLFNETLEAPVNIF
ncbi:uncharacterized protein OCT59_010078 [Rhizophagus irregularis]|uniref:uncharacterized protein n=1 Tax=Rhizophagus irregularis TaxID=588596 RepID=UPI00331DF730|nr:hypothetical protein OCT59_010078 [Rhizophagus irregularis]